MVIKELPWRKANRFRLQHIEPSQIIVGLKELDSRICPICMHKIEEGLEKSALLVEYAVRGKSRWAMAHKIHIRDLEQTAQVLNQIEIETGKISDLEGALWTE